MNRRGFFGNMRKFGPIIIVVAVLSLLVSGLPALAAGTDRGAGQGAAQSHAAADGPAKVTSAPIALAAAQAARRQHSRVEIAADRTVFSQTFANPDGTSTLEASSEPRWVKRGSSWVTASANLERQADGTWSPAAAENQVSFSGGGDTVLATLHSGKRWMSVSWPSPLPAPQVSGSTATYKDVFPHVDLVVNAQLSGGFDEILVIRDQAGAADPGLANLRLGVAVSGGLSQHPGAGGSVSFETADGTAVFSSPAPVAWDSGAGQSDVHGPAPDAHVAATGAAYGRGSVRLSIPATLLAGPASSFPVYIDPSYLVTSTTMLHDEVASSAPTTAFLNVTDMQVGFWATQQAIERSYFQMSIPSQLYGSRILSATFHGTVLLAATSASTSHTVVLHQTDAISTSTTWNNQPGWGPSTSATFTTASTAPNQAVTWDMTSMVQSAANAQLNNRTVVLSNSSETNSAVWVAFSNSPTITITYDHQPAIPSSPSMSPQNVSSDGQLYTSSATPAFSAVSTDPDGDPVQYVVQIWSGSTIVASGTTGYTASGTAATWTDTTPLTDGATYTWYIAATDGTVPSYSCPPGFFCAIHNGYAAGPSFTVETDTPAAPTVTCAGYPAGAWSAQISGGATCSWTAPLPHMNGYVLTLDGADSWVRTTSAAINPGPGLHTLTVTPHSAAGIWGQPSARYTFGVGTGAMLAPADGSQTATTIPLQAAAPSGYTSATIEYRQGTTGSFQPIAGNVQTTAGANVSWPVSTTANAAGVQTAPLTWYVTRSLADDGPVQIQAVFTNSSGGTTTTPPVTVTLNRIGTGTDFGTTTAGPVTVGLQSGNAAVSATDVNIASYGAGLAVTRTFNSLEPSQPSVFGPGWTTSLTSGVTAAWTQLSLSGSYVVLQAADGTNDTFNQGSTSNGITSWIPQGAAVTSGLTLTQNTIGSTFTLTDSSGTVTMFGQPSSAAGYVPQTVTVPGDASSAGFVYDSNSSDGTFGDPLLMVAPDAASSQPSTTACPYPASASTWTAGCRGLQFSYNASDDVSQISFVYTDNGGAFHSVPVADYGYDSAGKLTSEWDPRLATPLVTGYSYDETASDPDLGRITQITPAQAAGSGVLAAWTLRYDDTSGDADYGKILTVSRTHSATYGGGTATTTIGYSVPLTTSAGGPVGMDASTVGTWGQTDIPASAVAIFPPNHVPASPPTAADYQYASEIDYYDTSGRQVNTASYINGGWAVNTTQYDTYGNTTSTLSAANRAAALASSDPSGTAYELSAINLYGCDNFGTVGPCISSDQQYEVLTDTYSPAYSSTVDGTTQTVRTHTADSYDAGAPDSDTSADGTPYMLVTSQTVSASVGSGIPGSATADARTTSYTYGNASTNIGWILGKPLTTVIDPTGLHLLSTSVYNTSSSLYNGANLQTGSYMPSDTGGGGAGDTETVYYTAATNPVVAACGNKPEWANLTCQTGPAAQPGTAGLPPLPVTTYTYDDYLNATAKTEAFGSTGTRTTTTGYDSGERRSTQTIAVTGTGMGTAVPGTRTVYSAGSGLPTDIQTLGSSGNVTADINTTYDDFGDPLTYTDSGNVTTSYTYDIADRVTSRHDSAGTQTVTYSGSSAAPVQIADPQAGTFTATYNPDGSLATETYPGGITATYTYDPNGSVTSLSYNGPSWTAPLTDTVLPNGTGDWANQVITDTAIPLVSNTVYGYDSADRLTSAQDALAGLCTTRAYAYDADSNRTSLTSYAPNSDGTCQASSGTAVTHSYDGADRATSTGYAYDTQGDTTTTPSADAGGTGDLTATYYANDMLASQAQNGATMTWALDPTQGRFSSYTQDGVTYHNTYSDGGNNPTSVTDSNGNWTRNITDFKGMLAAQVTASGTTLDLTDLHGDVMATATTSTTSTGPTATYTYTEFGTPETAVPSTYGWLGGDQISNNALGGQLLMGARSYNTNAGRFAQTDPIQGSSDSTYDYSAGNPVTHSDVTGQQWRFIGWAFGSTRWYGVRGNNALTRWILDRVSFYFNLSVVKITISGVEAQLRWSLAVYQWIFDGPTPWFAMYATVAMYMRAHVRVTFHIPFTPINVTLWQFETPAIRTGICRGWLEFDGNQLIGSGACGLV